MVDRVDVNSVLMQMRQVKSQLRMQQEQPAAIQSQSVGQTSSTLDRGSMTSSMQGVAPSSFQQQLTRQLETVTGNQPGESVRNDPSVPDFSTMMANGIRQVNETQQAASALATRFEQGDPTVDLPEVMIAMQKSSVSFQAMTQVRNKLVEAYKDVMNMPV